MDRSEPLELRITHGYVGTYRDLDQWRIIGRMTVEAEETQPLDVDPEDPCDPRLKVMFIKVRPDCYTTDREVGQALADSFTAWGCAHDWDCCGCRSYSAAAKKIGPNYWRVEQHSSRNY